MRKRELYQSSPPQSNIRDKLPIIVAILAATTTMASGLLAAFVQKDQRSIENELISTHQSKLASTLKEQMMFLEENERSARHEAQLIREQYQALKKSLEGLSVTEPIYAAHPAEIEALQKELEKLGSETGKFDSRIGEIDARVGKIEDVILTSPEKALSLPLLARDIKALEDRTDRGLAALKSESDRVYDLMKWVLGLMGLVSLSLVGTAVGNVFKKEAPREPPSTGRLARNVDDPAREPESASS